MGFNRNPPNGLVYMALAIRMMADVMGHCLPYPVGRSHPRTEVRG